MAEHDRNRDQRIQTFQRMMDELSGADVTIARARAIRETLFELLGMRDGGVRVDTAEETAIPHARDARTTPFRIERSPWTVPQRAGSDG